VGDPRDPLTLDCPFLRPPMADRAGGAGASACCRLPSGHTRAISAATLAQVCSQGHYAACPGYRFWRVVPAAGRPATVDRPG
jgi:hypothetical protein